MTSTELLSLRFSRFSFYLLNRPLRSRTPGTQRKNNAKEVVPSLSVTPTGKNKNLCVLCVLGGSAFAFKDFELSANFHVQGGTNPYNESLWRF